MENNNGKGIFLGVVSVATLVVAIIGATFAYFATGVTASNSVTATGSEVKMLMSNDINMLKTLLVPVETGFKDVGQEKDTDGYAFNESTLAKKFAESPRTALCRDLNENNICSVYTFTVTNDSRVYQNVRAFLTPSVNTIASIKEGETIKSSDLKYAVFKGTWADVTAEGKGVYVNGTAKTLSTAQNGDLLIAATNMPVDKQKFELKALAENIEGNKNADGTAAAEGVGTRTYTIVTWIEETGVAQGQGGEFAGLVSFESSNGTGVTGLLATSQASGQQG